MPSRSAAMCAVLLRGGEHGEWRVLEFGAALSYGAEAGASWPGLPGAGAGAVVRRRAEAAWMNVVSEASRWFSRSRSSFRSAELLGAPVAVNAASAGVSASRSPETGCTRNRAASALAPRVVALGAGRQVVSSGCVWLVMEPQG